MRPLLLLAVLASPPPDRGSPADAEPPVVRVLVMECFMPEDPRDEGIEPAGAVPLSRHARARDRVFRVRRTFLPGRLLELGFPRVAHPGAEQRGK